MDFKIERGLLIKGLSQICGVVQRRNTMPVLGHVLLETREDSVLLRATDMERDIIVEVKGDIRSAGKTSIAAHLLHDIARKMPEGSEISLASDEKDQNIIVKTEASVFHFMAIDADEFPSFPEPLDKDKTAEFSIGSAELKRMIEKTRFAILDDSTRYYLNGIYLHASKNKDDKKLYAVATDGHRLASCHTALPMGAENITDAIIPKKCVDELLKIIDDAQKPVQISLSENIIRFDFGEVVLVSKLINGTFPDYQKIIPADNATKAQVAVPHFIQVVDRIGTISIEKTRAVKLSFEKDMLQVSAFNHYSNSGLAGSGASRAEENMDIKYKDKPLSIGFNARYLQDVASAIAVEDMTIAIKNPDSPVLITSNSADDMFFVIMPMRV